MSKDIEIKLVDLRAMTDEEWSFFQPSEEDMKDYWSGEGTLTFTVISNRPDVFEIEIEDMTGCVGGLDEQLGTEYAIREGYLGDREGLREGYTYHWSQITVSWFKGDGWTTDDDCDYYVEAEEFKRLPLLQFIKLKIKNAWWFNIGWRFRK